MLDTTGEHLESGGVFFVEATEDRRKLSYVVASDLPNFLPFLLLEDLGEERWPFDQRPVAAAGGVGGAK